jgi:hypothetical protein
MTDGGAALQPGAGGMSAADGQARRVAPETLAGLRAAPDFGYGPDLDDDPDLDDSPGFYDGPGFDGGPGLDDSPGFDDGPGYDGGPGLDDGPGLDAAPGLEPVTEPLAPAAPATALATRRQPMLTPAPQPTGSRAISPVRVPEREWGIKPHEPGYVGPETPTDVKIVVGLLCVVVVAAAVMIGMLVSNALAAVVVGVVGFLVIAAFLWFARL